MNNEAAVAPAGYGLKTIRTGAIAKQPLRPLVGLGVFNIRLILPPFSSKQI
jgi:hypothetical protein